MNEEEKMMIERERQNLELKQQEINQGNVPQEMQTLQLREQQRSWVHDQINLGEELDFLEHLLKGEILTPLKDESGKPTGAVDWVEPEDTEQIILSSHGVHLIMNTLGFYLNKNTLLSNYDEETIKQKMEDFSITLADAIFMEYEKVFLYPTEKELQDKLMERIQKKAERRQFAYSLIGKEVDIENIKEEFITEIETKIEIEITKIREQIIKNKLKRFELIIREVQDAVHSTYLRALYGAERRTLRQHSNYNETAGFQQQPIKQKMSMNPMNIFRRR